jgi:signal transduction histidine kinase
MNCWRECDRSLRLKHSVDERDQIARQREDFVSRLTHDLRTPLVAADRMLLLLQQECWENYRQICKKRS